MTYGWALLVVLVSLGSLTFYFGYDNSSFASETCFFGPGLGCSDMLVNEDSISLKVMNSLGKDMTSFSVSSDNCGVSSDNPRLDNGDEVFLTLSECSFNPEDLIEESLSLTYTFIDSSLEHVKDATLTAVVEGGTSQAFGGGGSGGGYGSDGNTIALYKFDEGDGNLVSDSSSNGMHGSYTTLGELIDNGDAETNTLENFDGQYNFQGIRDSGCNLQTGDYCFYRDGTVAHVRSNEYIEIDLNKEYNLSGDFKSTGVGESKLYFGYVPLDENYERIESRDITPFAPNTETTLFESVSPSDTSVKILDGSNWGNGGYIAFDIDDSGSYNDLPNSQLSSFITDVIEHPGEGHWEIVVDSANENFPAGTKIREHNGAGSYMYAAFDTGPPDDIPFTWKNLNGVTIGENVEGVSFGKWWRGTKYVQLLMLPNWGQGATYSLDVDDLSLVTDPITYTQKWETGKFGTALEFNGKEDSIKIPFSPEMLVTDQFTVEFWANPHDFSPGAQRLVTRSGSWAVTLDEGTINFFTDTGSVEQISFELPNVDQWYHVAGTYDGIHMKLFVDGNEEATTDQQSGNLRESGNSAVFIGSNAGTGQYFNGLIDEVRLSDYVRYT